jgi:hypothetical protein
MQQDVAYLLGDTKDWTDTLSSRIRLTSGATEDRSRRRSLPFLKISGRIRGPRTIIPYLGDYLLQMGVSLASLRFNEVSRNVITLVPKSWKTFRTIAKEPTHSLPFQLSLDSFLKQRLRRWGIDLSSQEKNQAMAKEGSENGSLATIDLEMASDTLSLNAVALLLPSDWFRIFSDFRSSFFSAPWGEGEYAKFSSMGNGYTFTLETLIFTAACRAVGSRRYAVYGDDIVIESERASSLVKLLKLLGFRTNDAKSFINPLSRFRESCGCDYYKGVLVTPFYLRELPRLEDRASMSHVLNGLVSCWPVPCPLWDFVADHVRKLDLRLVPWNEDSRSGIFTTPGFCWRNKKLKVYRSHRSDGVVSPLTGFPVYNGYGTTQDVRKTHGWRSYLLWHINKRYGDVGVLPSVTGHSSENLLRTTSAFNAANRATATVTSEVSNGTRYIHKLCRYDPRPYATPSYLFLWDEVVGVVRPR